MPLPIRSRSNQIKVNSGGSELKKLQEGTRGQCTSWVLNHVQSQGFQGLNRTTTWTSKIAQGLEVVP
eukprot:12897004-Prorocentrum_lima.AAC.1